MAKGKKMLWIEPTGGGIHQKNEATLIHHTEAKMLYNITHDQPGSWVSRSGNNLIASTLAGGNPIRGLGSRENFGGTAQLIAIYDGDVYKWNDISSLGSTIGSSAFGATESVNTANFLERLYMAGGGTTTLKYTNGSTTSNATGTPQVRYIAVAQDTLWAAGKSGSEDYVFASLYDEANNTPTDQLYEDTETWATSSRYFVVDGEVTGIGSFKDLPVVFTKTGLWTSDIRDFSSLHGPVKLASVGSTSHRSIAVDNKLHVLMFAGNDGIFLWTGAGDPINIIDKCINRVDANALWDDVNPANYATMHGACWDGKYYLAVGNLQDNTTDYYQNGCFVYDIAANKISFRSLASSMIVPHIKTTGEKKLFFGSNSTGSVYETHIGTQDDDSAGTPQNYVSYVNTKRFSGEFGSVTGTKTWHSIVVGYTSDEDITVKQDINGTGTYSTLGTLTASSDEVRKALTFGEEGEDVSLQFSTASGRMKIKAFGFEYTLHDSIRLAYE